MAGSARSVLTRLLPWAALAVMTVMFFVQVKARHRAHGEAVKARDDLATQRALQVGPKPAPLPPARVEIEAVAKPAGDAEAELGAQRKRIEALHEELAAAQGARADLVAANERLEALRTTEAARADALEAEVEGWKDAAGRRVEELEAKVKEAEALLEQRAAAPPEPRRESRVTHWIVLADAGTPGAQALIRAEAAQATDEDVAELRAHWSATRLQDGQDAVATVLAAMPVTASSAALAADVMLTLESPRAAGAMLARLGEHTRHVDAVVRLLAEGSNELRADVVQAAGGATWSKDEQQRLGAALEALLADKDPWTVEIAIRALARLGLRGHAAALLPFLTHTVPAVRIASVYALLATSDRTSAVRTLHPVVTTLLEDAEPDVRLAGLFLAQELAGEKRSLAFGSSDQAVAQEIERLKAKLATMAKE